jgi:hypothetical protein
VPRIKYAVIASRVSVRMPASVRSVRSASTAGFEPLYLQGAIHPLQVSSSSHDLCGPRLHRRYRSWSQRGVTSPLTPRTEAPRRARRRANATLRAKAIRCGGVPRPTAIAFAFL